MKIAIIGAGNMGSAIAASLTGGDNKVVCTAKTASTLEKISREIPGIETTTDNRDAVCGADIVILAVKPYIADGVIKDISDNLKEGSTVISVIASLTTDNLAEMTGADKKSLQIFRAIPNTAIRYKESVTFIAHARGCSHETIRNVEHIFSLSGHPFVVDEKDMAACTALSSCGIAYFLRFIRAAAEGSVELGLKASFATRIAALTAASAAAVLSEGSHPEAEIDKVTTPGGITIKGLNTLEANGFTAAVIAALKASCPQ